ncbi:hypothetical protein VOI32_00815 [Paraburkholderia caribensis]|uniref:Lipoprotein n=1 Tax=Paraburkholderia caribensis TaxID=75105 RepID=A0A9Q6S0E7_9BURK|nr:hypothetical protein [Paraburkholderia caribensis]MCO4875570.1 hypothetical protein [Paraburkholderia caribensis]PTB30511.1 hypothetical protein C9I56_01825 [Paraburkholderia caribensis]QLB62248.1 hypothetical protein A9O66_07560 [Paraburkholderia caribensis]
MHWDINRSIGRALAPCCLGLVLAACATIRLNNLDSAERNADPVRRNIPFLEGKVNPDYRLEPQDLLVLSAPKGQAITAVTARPSDATWLARPLQEFRIPIGILELFNALEIVYAGNNATVKLKLCDGSPPCKPRLTEQSAQQVLAKLHALTSLKVAIEPVEPVRVDPGDSVFLARDSRILIQPEPSTAGTSVPALLFGHSERFELIVDNQGRVDFPSLSVLSAQLAADVQGRPAIRAALDGENTRFRLAIPGASRSAQPTLAAISWCLSADYAPTAKTDTLVDHCRALGITGFITPDQDGGAAINAVRYRLEAGRRSWRLVDEKNRSITMDYVYGATILESVSEAYRVLTGHELVEQWHATAFVTVLPREGAERPREKPFFGRVRLVESSASSPLGRFLLMPGDTVHISRFEPRADGQPSD